MLWNFYTKTKKLSQKLNVHAPIHIPVWRIPWGGVGSCHWLFLFPSIRGRGEMNVMPESERNKVKEQDVWPRPPIHTHTHTSNNHQLWDPYFCGNRGPSATLSHHLWGWPWTPGTYWTELAAEQTFRWPMVWSDSDVVYICAGIGVCTRMGDLLWYLCAWAM